MDMNVGVKHQPSGLLVGRTPCEIQDFAYQPRAECQTQERSEGNDLVSPEIENVTVG
jgi:hypothetical protein